MPCGSNGMITKSIAGQRKPVRKLSIDGPGAFARAARTEAGAPSVKAGQEIVRASYGNDRSGRDSPDKAAFFPACRTIFFAGTEKRCIFAAQSLYKTSITYLPDVCPERAVRDGRVLIVLSGTV